MNPDNPNLTPRYRVIKPGLMLTFLTAQDSVDIKMGVGTRLKSDGVTVWAFVTVGGEPRWRESITTANIITVALENGWIEEET